MSKTVTKISKGEIIHYSGDLIVEQDIDASAEVNITDGDLIVHGNIKEGAKINITMSESLRPKSSVAGIFGNIMGNIIISSGSSRYSNSSVNFGNRELMIGNVCIDNRIFSNDQVEDLRNNQFKITPAGEGRFGMLSNMSSSRVILNGVEQVPIQSTPGFATAKIDGKLYQGKEIIVKDKVVYVDGKIPSESASSSSTASTPAPTPRATPKVVIYGSVGDSVVINSDAEMTIHGTIGMSCEISSEYSGLKTKEIGESCTIKASSVSATIIHQQTSITCNNGSLTAKTLKDKVTVNASKEIKISEHVGNGCILKSEYDGLTAQNIGNNVVVKVSKGIDVANIGSNSRMESEYQGINANAVGDKTRLEVSKSIEIDSIGKDGVLKSEYQGVTVHGAAGQDTKITASKEIKVGQLLGSNHLISEYQSIQVVESAGAHCSLKASRSIDAKNIFDHCRLESEYQEVNVENIFDHVTVKASKNIYVTGYCSPSASLTSEYGKVKKANKPKPVVNVIQRNHDNDDEDLQLAIALSESEMSKQQGQFSPSASSSTASNALSHPNNAAVPSIASHLMGRFGDFLQNANIVRVSDALNTQGVFATPAAVPAAIPAAVPAAPAAKPASSEIPEAYICIITLDIMNDPVICMLDGKSYENNAIRAWLKEHNMSPSRNPIPAGLSVDQVLAPNRNLKELIDAFKADNNLVAKM